MGLGLGVFAVLFQQCNSYVETKWFYPMSISIVYLKGV